MMVDFEAVICHFWPKALHAIRSWGQDASDERGIRAIRDKNLATRQYDLREWLRSYSVFQGLTTVQRDPITEAVLTWANARNPGRDLATPEALAEAHKGLERICQACIMNRPDAKERDFTSLASKALWLCYPESVPLYDRYAKNALHAIAKLEEQLRRMLELPAVLAARRPDPGLLQEIRNAVGQYELAALDRNWSRAVSHDLHFHGLLVRFHGNKRLDSFYKNMLGELRVGMVLVDRSHDNPGALIAVHLEMCQLLTSGELQRCAAVLEQHRRTPNQG